MDTQLAKESFNYSNEPGNEWIIMIVKCHKIPSVNSQYNHGKHGQLYRSPELVQFEQELKDQIVLCDPVKLCPWIKPDGLYDVTFDFIMNRSFWRRDVSNCVKGTEDSIFRCLGVDDSRVLRHFDSKTYLKDAEFERVIFKIQPSNHKWNRLND